MDQHSFAVVIAHPSTLASINDRTLVLHSARLFGRLSQCTTYRCRLGTLFVLATSRHHASLEAALIAMRNLCIQGLVAV